MSICEALKEKYRAIRIIKERDCALAAFCFVSLIALRCAVYSLFAVLVFSHLSISFFPPY